MRSSRSTAALTERRTVVAYQAPTVLVVIVGLGGTGSWVAAHMIHQIRRFNRIWNRAIPARRAALLLVDYDRVSASNVEARQNFYPFEIGHPKAQVLANRFQLGFNLPPNEIGAVVAPFSASLIPQMTPDHLVIIVGCVDNPEARQSIAKVLESQPAPSHIWWVDAGNERDFGQTFCGNTANAADLVGSLAQSPGLALPSPALLAPTLIEVPSPSPLQETVSRVFSCGTVQVDEPEQSETINFTMAGTVAHYVHQLLSGGVHTFATYSNMSLGIETRSEQISALALAQALGHADAEAFARTLVAAPKKPASRKKTTE